MKTMNDKFTLSNGMQIPCIGFGTYNPQGGDNIKIIQTAIDVGYRYFDTASLYETERALGSAIKGSGIAREEFFVASKLWMDETGYEGAFQALGRTLERLQMDYLDLYLIHWPKADEKEAGWKQRNIDTWRAMEELCTEGKVRALGLSNFLPHHLDVIMENATVKPVVNQLELHPGYMQHAAVSYTVERGVLPQAWSPLGRAKLTENPFVLELAAKYGKSAAQVCLRYLLQKNINPLVKASGEERMKANIDIFDFEIEKEDIHVLDCLPQTAWSGEHPDFAVPKVTSKFFC